VTQIEQPPPEPTYPYPPRYWWLKRLALLGLLVIIGIACLRVWWGRVAQRELHRVVADLRARGEPVWRLSCRTCLRSASASASLPCASNTRARLFCVLRYEG
jgi:hypothetical protein